jgi:DNA-directed RNA polymerase subunit RPC12/RpoP
MNRASRTETKAAGGLHVCPDCSSRLVQPTRWEQTAKRGHWRLWRRCPECEWRRDGIHDEGEIDAFDEALDDGAEALAAELQKLERESMEEIADVFSTALAADLITADDFA